METKTAMQAFQIDMKCEKCDGNMRPTGNTLLSFPPQYPHKCDSCDNQEVYRVSYPYISHQPVEDAV